MYSLQEARTFVQLLAETHTKWEPPLLRQRMEQAWRLRWFSILSCAAARAFAASLLELRGSMGWLVTHHLTMRMTGVSTTQGCAGDHLPAVARDKS